MPPDHALLSTLIGSNYPCLKLILMVPKVFEPLKFDCSYTMICPPVREIIQELKACGIFHGITIFNIFILFQLKTSTQ